MNATVSRLVLLRAGELPSGALVLLARRTAAGQIGVWVARIVGGLVTLFALALMAWFARAFGPDDAIVTVASHTAALVTAWAGCASGFGLASRTASEARAVRAMESLASTRGFSRGAVRAAEIAACVVLVVEVVLAPVLLLAVFAWALLAVSYAAGAWRALGTIVPAGAAAALLLGAGAGLCRVFGGRAGRVWLLALLVVPWAFSTVSASSLLRDWLSIPELVGRVW